MAKNPQDQYRRVYVLPAELVERILEFQYEKGLSSEVDAVRRLLDEALRARDTPVRLLGRTLRAIEDMKLPYDVAREVLVGHPLVSDLSFKDEEVEIWIRGAGHFKFNAEGELYHDEDGGGSFVKITDIKTLRASSAKKKDGEVGKASDASSFSKSILGLLNRGSS